MVEKLDLDRLEALLEDHEPAEVRHLYAQELAENAAFRELLAVYEGMGDDLVELKLMDPAPTLPVPRRRVFPYAWVLPLTALLMLGFLAWMRVLPSMQEMAPEATQSRGRALDDFASAPTPATEEPAEAAGEPAVLEEPAVPEESAGPEMGIVRQWRLRFASR